MTQSRQRPSDTAMETNVSWAQGGKGPSFPENAEVKSCICDEGPQIDRWPAHGILGFGSA